MTRYWLGVVSREHVKRAQAGGFCQFNHGKEAPVGRLGKGDGIVYYSPRETMAPGKPLRAFTAIGVVTDGAPYQVEQSGDFKPFRREVRYLEADDTPIEPLLPRLSFSRGDAHWGQVLRRGLVEIESDDFAMIREAMTARLT